MSTNTDNQNIEKKPSNFGFSKRSKLLNSTESTTDKEVLSGNLENGQENKSQTNTTETIINQEKRSLVPAQKLKNRKIKKGSQITDIISINIGKQTRDRLKLFCVNNGLVMLNWTDETLWKAMDKYERDKKEKK